MTRCFCGMTHCPHSRAVAASLVRQWARSKTPEERAAMAKEATEGVLRLLRGLQLLKPRRTWRGHRILSMEEAARTPFPYPPEPDL